MTDRYFVVELTNGVVLVFDKKCDSVDYANDNYVIFKETVNHSNKSYRCLAIIPHSSIFAITARKKED